MTNARSPLAPASEDPVFQANPTLDLERRWFLVFRERLREVADEFGYSMVSEATGPGANPTRAITFRLEKGLDTDVKCRFCEGSGSSITLVDKASGETNLIPLPPIAADDPDAHKVMCSRCNGAGHTTIAHHG